MVLFIEVQVVLPQFVHLLTGRKDTSNEFKQLFPMKIWMLIVILITGLLVIVVNFIIGTIILIGLMVIVIMSWREKSPEIPDTLTIERLKRKRELEEKNLLDAKNREF